MQNFTANKLGIYIHIPFCIKKCPYCDFNSYEQKVPEKEYTQALLKEIRQRGASNDWQDREVSTIFFGGGTPSLFSGESIKTIIEAVRDNFNCNRLSELTLEANPFTIKEPSHLDGYVNAGVNRISFGSQSFNDKKLNFLGRLHQSSHIETSVRLAKEVGLTNINLDIIFGTKFDNLEILQNDLERAISLDPKHLSIYGLTIEPGTTFSTQFKKGEILNSNDESFIEQFRLINNKLHECGYKRYEVSNFALTGFECKHNLNYWERGEFIGFGAGAHSFHDNKKWGRRWTNIHLPKTYIEKDKREILVKELDQKDARTEYLFLRLRTAKGLNYNKFNSLFGDDILNTSEYQILSKEGLIDTLGDFILLTNKGFEVMDSVISEFI